MTLRRLAAALSGCALSILAAPTLASQGSGCMPTTGIVSGLTFAGDITAAIAALISSNSGNSAPATDCTAAPVKGQIWLDLSVSPNHWRVYDGANWLDLGTLDATLHAWTPAYPAGELSNFRLTLLSGVPVLNGNVVSGATSTYCSPYNGNLLPIWNGQNFIETPSVELTQTLSDATKSPSAAAAANVYDIFAWSDSGTLRCTRGPAWSAGTGGSNTVRGTGSGGAALTRVNGLWVNANAIANGPAAGYGTYIGTIATDSGGATVSWSSGGTAVGNLNVWNNFNRVNVMGLIQDPTANHTYSSTTIRMFDNSAANRVNFVAGLPEDVFYANFVSAVSTAAAGGFAKTYLGLDSTTAAAAGSSAGVVQGTSSTLETNLTATLNLTASIGAHYLQALESSDGTNANTFVGGSTMAFLFSLRM